MKEKSQALSELAVIVVRYANKAEISGSEQHAEMAGVDRSVVKYLKHEGKGEEPVPAVSDVVKVFSVLNLKEEFKNTPKYIDGLIRSAFPGQKKSALLGVAMTKGDRRLPHRERL